MAHMELSMNIFFTLIILILPYMLSASSSESEIKVAILGKFAHFVKHKTPTKNDNFVITVFKDKNFVTLLQKKYAKKKINKKNVEVNAITEISNIQRPDILYIGDIPQEEQAKVITTAYKHSLFSVSSQSGFAQRGGILQLYFLSQKIRFKINLTAAKKSNLKISASLLSIATLVKGNQQ